MKIPGPAVAKIVLGVRPIVGEMFRYHVRSRGGDSDHLVDLSENGFYGQCSCEAFRFKYGPKLAGGIPLDNSLQCYHIKLARRHFTETMLRRLWWEINKEKPKPTRVEPPPRRTYQLKPELSYGN